MLASIFNLCQLKVMGKNASGFTLIELLVVIAIITILTSIAISSFNGTNIKVRDAVRLTDLSKVHQIIIASTHDSTNMASTLCYNNTPPCSGKSYEGELSSQNTNGSGWIKINLNDSSSSNLPLLPLDPVNNDQYYYEYYSDGVNWKLSVALESDQNKNKMANDGGQDSNRWEIGSNLKRLQ